jgi:hypothetical protein
MLGLQKDASDLAIDLRTQRSPHLLAYNVQLEERGSYHRWQTVPGKVSILILLFSTT